MINRSNSADCGVAFCTVPFHDVIFGGILPIHGINSGFLHAGLAGAAVSLSSNIVYDILKNTSFFSWLETKENQSLKRSFVQIVFRGCIHVGVGALAGTFVATTSTGLAVGIAAFLGPLILKTMMIALETLGEVIKNSLFKTTEDEIPDSYKFLTEEWKKIGGNNLNSRTTQSEKLEQTISPESLPSDKIIFSSEVFSSEDNEEQEKILNILESGEYRLYDSDHVKEGVYCYHICELSQTREEIFDYRKHPILNKKFVSFLDREKINIWDIFKVPSNYNDFLIAQIFIEEKPELIKTWPFFINWNSETLPLDFKYYGFDKLVLKTLDKDFSLLEILSKRRDDYTVQYLFPSIIQKYQGKVSTLIKNLDEEYLISIILKNTNCLKIIIKHKEELSVDFFKEIYERCSDRTIFKHFPDHIRTFQNFFNWTDTFSLPTTCEVLDESIRNDPDDMKTLMIKYQNFIWWNCFDDKDCFELTKKVDLLDPKNNLEKMFNSLGSVLKNDPKFIRELMWECPLLFLTSLGDEYPKLKYAIFLESQIDAYSTSFGNLKESQEFLQKLCCQYPFIFNEMCQHPFFKNHFTENLNENLVNNFYSFIKSAEIFPKDNKEGVFDACGSNNATIIDYYMKINPNILTIDTYFLTNCVETNLIFINAALRLDKSLKEKFEFYKIVTEKYLEFVKSNYKEQKSKLLINVMSQAFNQFEDNFINNSLDDFVELLKQTDNSDIQFMMVFLAGSLVQKSALFVEFFVKLGDDFLLANSSAVSKVRSYIDEHKGGEIEEEKFANNKYVLEINIEEITEELSEKLPKSVHLFKENKKNTLTNN